MVTNPTCTQKSHKSWAITKKNISKWTNLITIPRHPNTSWGVLGRIFWGPNTFSPGVWMSRASLFVRRLNRHTVMCDRRPNAYGTVAEHTARLSQGVLLWQMSNCNKNHQWHSIILVVLWGSLKWPIMIRIELGSIISYIHPPVKYPGEVVKHVCSYNSHSWICFTTKWSKKPY